MSSVFGWGDATSGALLSSTKSRLVAVSTPGPSFGKTLASSPQLLDELGASGAFCAAAGASHTLVGTQWGEVLSFGRSEEGQLGREGDAEVALRVRGIGEAVRDVEAGGDASFALSESGTLFEWGARFAVAEKKEKREEEGGEGEEREEKEREVEDEEMEAARTVLPGLARDLSHNPRLQKIVMKSAMRYLSATEGEEEDGEGGGRRRRDEAGRGVVRVGVRREYVTVPRVALGLERVVVRSVAAGWAHCIAIGEDGVAYAAGMNDRGQLGLGTRLATATFRPMVRVNENGTSSWGDASFVDPPSFVTAACGQSHTLLVDEEGRVWSCGSGGLGQLGLGWRSDRLHASRLAPLPCLRDTSSSPHPPSSPQGSPATIQAVACGANHSLLLADDGTLWGAGHSEYNQLTLCPRSLAARGDLALPPDFFRVPRPLGVDFDEAVFQRRGAGGRGVGGAWSGFYTGEVDARASSKGRVSGGMERRVKSALGIKWPMQGPLSNAPVTQIAAGPLFSAIVTDQGHLITFGWNDFAVLGRGNVLASEDASPLPEFAEKVVQKIACGDHHVLTISDSEAAPHAAALRSLRLAPTSRKKSTEKSSATKTKLHSSKSTATKKESPTTPSHARKLKVSAHMRRQLERVADRIAGIAERREAEAVRAATRVVPKMLLQTAADRAEEDKKALALSLADVAIIPMQKSLKSAIPIPAPASSPSSPSSPPSSPSSPPPSSSSSSSSGLGWEEDVHGGVLVWRSEGGERVAYRPEGPPSLAHGALLVARWPCARKALLTPGEDVGVAWSLKASESLWHRFAPASSPFPPNLKTLVFLPGLRAITVQDILDWSYLDAIRAPTHRRAPLLALRSQLRGEEAEAVTGKEGGKTAFVDDMEWLMESEAMSDIQVVGQVEGGGGGGDGGGGEGGSGGGERRWNLHRAVLFRSPFFRTLFQARSEEHVLRIGDVGDLDALHAVLQWCYTGRDEDLQEADLPCVLELGTRFCLSDLVRAAEAAAIQVPVDPDTNLALLQLAEALGLDRLMIVCKSRLTKGKEEEGIGGEGEGK